LQKCLYTCRNNELISDMIMNFAYVEVRNIKKYTFSCTYCIVSFQIFEDDSLSKLICLSCIEKLIATYDFKDLIVNSDTQLRLQNDMFEKPDDEMQGSCSVSQPDEESNFEFQCQPATFIKCEEKENDSGVNKKEDDVLNQKNVDVINDKSKKLKGRSKMFKCDQCQKTFKNRYSLISHKAIHTGSFPHSCDVCNKGFPTNWAMNVHRRVHFEERPFQCENCDKSFKYGN
jgi:hypothetical protein